MIPKNEKNSAGDLAVSGRVFEIRRRAANTQEHNRSSLTWQSSHSKSSSQPYSKFLISLDTAFEEFLLDCESRRLSPKTIRYYRQQLRPFLEYLRRQEVTT